MFQGFLIFLRLLFLLDFFIPPTVRTNPQKPFSGTRILNAINIQSESKYGMGDQSHELISKF